MFPIVRPFVMIALLRAGPQDLPASPPILALTLIGYLVLGFAISAPYYGAGVALAQAAVDPVILAAFCWLALGLRGCASRFVQALTALAGTGVVIGVFLLPLTLLMAGAGEGGPLAGVVGLFYLAIVCWLLLAWGHIFRNALDLGWPGWGILIALSYLVASALAIDALTGGMSAA